MLDNDQIKCWGHNGYGQLGYGDTIARGNTAGSMALLSTVNLGAGRSAKNIALGDDHSCAVLDNNQIKCWGDNSSGQLGYDDTINRGSTAGSMALLSTVNLGAGRSAKSIALGRAHSCAVLDNDQIKCWGYNSTGELGYNNQIYSGAYAGSMALFPTVNLGVGRSVKRIELGGYHTCALLDNDQIKCWGYNGYGQLGYDNTEIRGTSFSITEDSGNLFAP